MKRGSLIFSIFLLFFCFIFSARTYVNASEEQPSKVGISLFMHVCTLNNWQSILEEQLSRIKNFGLYDACDNIFLGVLGSGDISSFQERYPKVTILFQDPNTGHYERPTLLSMRSFCQSCREDHVVLYLHTKGITREGNSNIQDWINYMEYFAIDRWQDCVKTLQNHDACGVNWHMSPAPHFSGNFWWATARYVSTLPGSIDGHYLAPEFWIGNNLPHVHCFHESGLDHYFSPTLHIDMSSRIKVVLNFLLD